MPFAPLNTTWFALIGLLWAGYFFLEGFDFGVAVVAPFVSRDDLDRRLCLNSIGPVWDGNEVWLIVAGGATFAAFPLWYAKLFSGFYLALFLVLLALIARGVSFEFRDKIDSDRWRRSWDVANFLGSLVPALVWGVAFTNLVHGVPLGPTGYTSGLLGLLHPYAILGGLAAVAVFCLHGSLFLSLKVTGPLADRATKAARLSGVAAVALLGGVVAWLGAAGRPPLPGELNAGIPLLFAAAALVAIAAATGAAFAGRSGIGFTATGAGILLVMAAVFSRMFPAVIPASNAAGGGGITIGAASSQHYTLVVMTVVAAIFTPVVLAYQGWTYWVFRQRLVRPVTGEH